MSLFDLLPQDILNVLLSFFDLEGLMIYLIINPLQLDLDTKKILINNHIENINLHENFIHNAYNPIKKDLCIICKILICLDKELYSYNLTKLLFNHNYIINNELSKELYIQIKNKKIYNLIHNIIHRTIIIYPDININVIGYLNLIINHKFESNIKKYDNYNKIKIIRKFYSNDYQVSNHPYTTMKDILINTKAFYSSNDDSDYDDNYEDDVSDHDKFSNDNIIDDDIKLTINDIMNKKQDITYYQIYYEYILYLYLYQQIDIFNNIYDWLKKQGYKMLIIDLEYYSDKEVSMIEVNTNKFYEDLKFITNTFRIYNYY